MPEALWRSRQEWHASRLRAVASTLPANEAGALLDDYLGQYPTDRDARARAVEAWVRAGREDVALERIGPLLEGADRAAWLRREADLAAKSGDARRAARALRDLESVSAIQAPDCWRLVNLLLESGDKAGAAAAVGRIDPRTDGCGESRLHALTRLGGTSRDWSRPCATERRAVPTRLSGSIASPARPWPPACTARR